MNNAFTHTLVIIAAIAAITALSIANKTNGVDVVGIIAALGGVGAGTAAYSAGTKSQASAPTPVAVSAPVDPVPVTMEGTRYFNPAPPATANQATVVPGPGVPNGG